MQSLTDLCIHNLAEQIYHSPPMIQEMIIGQSSDIIEKKVKKQVKKEVEKDLINELKVLKKIVPEISKHIIIKRSSFFISDTTDYYKIYDNIPRHIVKLAIDIAENTISELNDSFNILTFVSSRRYNFFTTEEESERESEIENELESELEIYENNSSDE